MYTEFMLYESKQSTLNFQRSFGFQILFLNPPKYLESINLFSLVVHTIDKYFIPNYRLINNKIDFIPRPYETPT